MSIPERLEGPITRDLPRYEGFIDREGCSRAIGRLRAPSPSGCLWAFRSAQCGYRGSAAWCDGRFARCLMLGNQRRYGGFPGLPV